MVTYVNRLSALINSKISVNILKFYFALHKVQDGFPGGVVVLFSSGDLRIQAPFILGMSPLQHGTPKVTMKDTKA